MMRDHSHSDQTKGQTDSNQRPSKVSDPARFEKIYHSHCKRISSHRSYRVPLAVDQGKKMAVNLTLLPLTWLPYPIPWDGLIYKSRDRWIWTTCFKWARAFEAARSCWWEVSLIVRLNCWFFMTWKLALGLEGGVMWGLYDRGNTFKDVCSGLWLMQVCNSWVA